MNNYAVIEDSIIVNLILADTLEIAEQVTDKKCIEYGSQLINIGDSEDTIVPMEIYRVIPNE
jgi:hypothetical protein